MEGRVFVAACPDYAQAEEKTAELIERMGGMGRFARPGETLLLKANLLAAAGPEQAVSTHPAVVGAAAKLVAGQGARAVIGDSPGWPSPGWLRPLQSGPSAVWAAASAKTPAPPGRSPWKRTGPASIPVTVSTATAAMSCVPKKPWR